ncbi:phosphotransferase family protein [Citricoccus sp. GCM10030269]|uniref:phosphotransferase family protein n=1 Tax=Citricoccus sp. GCM10030269 TaxID=3273388 RepID=UPI00360A7F49
MTTTAPSILTPASTAEVQQILDAILPTGLRPCDEVEMEPATPTFASPSWWGADSQRYLLHGTDGREAFVKVMVPSAVRFTDVASVFSTAAHAAAAGISPAVIAADPASGVLVTSTVVGHTATLGDFRTPEQLEPLAELRRRVRELPAMGRTVTVFEDLRTLRAEAEHLGATVPSDLDHLMRRAGQVEAAVLASGYDVVPCHGDGNLSNVLIDEVGRLSLVDWDVATNTDPLFDVGTLLAELTGPSWSMTSLESYETFEQLWGSYDRSAHARATAYGPVDSLRWALLGSCYDALEPGTQEYIKFADWQYLRARIALGAAELDDLMHLI